MSSLTPVDKVSHIVLSIIIGLVIGFLLQTIAIEYLWWNGSIDIGWIGGSVIVLVVYGIANRFKFTKRLNLKFLLMLAANFVGASASYIIGIWEALK